jgi:hypothetical protein
MYAVVFVPRKWAVNFSVLFFSHFFVNEISSSFFKSIYFRVSDNEHLLIILRIGNEVIGNLEIIE